MAHTKAIRNLPLVQVEVLASTREEIGLRDANVSLLCHLVLEWIHRNWEPSQLNIEQLAAKVLDISGATCCQVLHFYLFYLSDPSAVPQFG